MSQCMVGVPKEVKPQEGRVGITPDGVRELYALGIKVVVERGAGVLSGFSDDAYVSAGALILESVHDLYRDANMIVKVKELTPKEYWLIPLLKGKVLFTYLHLAGVDPELTKLLLKHEVTAIAYETVTGMEGGRTVFPLLVPMSRIAGVQSARTALLRHPKEQYRKLEVVILGGGVVGEAALNQMLMNEVELVSVFESREERVRELRAKYAGKQETLSVFPLSFLESAMGRKVLHGADIVISGVMLPGGAAAPKVLTQKHFRIMKHGAYIADVSIDQGGSTAWSKVTKPGETFTRGKNELVFSCVPNIPGSTVPREATEELTNVTLPFVELLGTSIQKYGVDGAWHAMRGNKDLRNGLQTQGGHVTNHFVAEKYGLQDQYQQLDRIF
ncbi:MAG: alanine dehydrogenase [bacterium]|nr:alanine dehydrogenase [bacterium]